MNIRLNIWTKETTATNQAVENNVEDNIAHVETDGDPNNDAANPRAEEPGKDRWWVYREAARFGVHFDLCL